MPAIRSCAPGPGEADFREGSLHIPSAPQPENIRFCEFGDFCDIYEFHDFLSYMNFLIFVNFNVVVNLFNFVKFIIFVIIS